MSENGPTSVEMSETFFGNALLLQENDNLHVVTCSKIPNFSQTFWYTYIGNFTTFYNHFTHGSIF